MKQEHLSKSVSDTQEIAAKVFLELKPGTTIFLYGDMGAGKTTFTQALIRKAGFDGEILSPTFVLHRRYPTDTYVINHFDLYRLEDIGQIQDLGIEEILASNDVCIIEWPEKIEDLLVDDIVKIKFDIVDEDNRRITIE